VSKAEEMKSLVNQLRERVSAKWVGSTGGPCTTRGYVPDALCVKAADTIDKQKSIIDEQRAEIERLKTPAPVCPVCGSDCNERSEIFKVEREIDSLQVEVPRLRGMVDRMTLIIKDKDTEIIRKDSKITRLNNLLRRGLSALEYHTELTRPIAQTNEVIHEFHAALSDKSKGGG
jgi:hypothetical protein